MRPRSPRRRGSAAPARRHCARATSGSPTYRSCRTRAGYRPARSPARAPVRRGRAAAHARNRRRPAAGQSSAQIFDFTARDGFHYSQAAAKFSRRWLHAERANPRARSLVAQRGEKRLHRRPLAPALDQQEIVVLGRKRQEAKAVELRHRLDRDAPVGARPARPRRRPRCATSAGWRSRAAARRRAACRSARACRRRHCG